MKTIMKLGFGILVLGLASCQLVGSEEAAPKTTDDTPLVDTEWDLVSFEEVGEGASDAGSVGILLIFEEDGRVKGGSYQKAGGPKAANQYSGIYKLVSPNIIVIDSMGTTLVGEPEGSRYTEYYSALRDTTEYELKGETLRLYYDTGSKALVFRARA